MTGMRDYGKYSEIARFFKLTPYAVKRWFMGETVPTSRINELASYLNVRAEWLLSNKGPMKEVEARYSTGETASIAIHRVPVIEPENYEDWKNGEYSVSSYCLAIGNISPGAFAYQLRDNSLFPRAVSGMIAVVDPQHEQAKAPVKAEKPVVILQSGAFAAGKYVWHGRAMIEPINPEYRPIYVSDNNKILGVITVYSQHES
ncbi:MAG: hypothetical protein ACTHWH_05965 [Marinobacter sp.]